MRATLILCLVGFCLSLNASVFATDKGAADKGAAVKGTTNKNAKAAQKKKDKAYPPEIKDAQVEVYKRIGEVALNAYIFQPEQASATPRPAIVFFFGGGWTSGSPTQFEHHCQYFAKRGMVAITADYRVASRHDVKAVSCVADAKSAIRWVRSNADRLGIDPNRIVAGGGSAGGHLAAATGTIGKFDEESEDKNISSIPNALALFNPALVLANVAGEADLNPEKLESLRERLGGVPEEMSPFHQVSQATPPAIIFHGKADTTVPYRTAELFDEAMKRHGRTCKLVGFEGAAHGFFNNGRGDDSYYQKTIDALDDFLVELDFLAPKGAK